MILRLRISQSVNSSSMSEELNRPRLSNTINMEASSNKERLAIFKNCLNSYAWVLPEPSAMLFVKRQSRGSQLLCITIESSLIEYIRQPVKI